MSRLAGRRGVKFMSMAVPGVVMSFAFCWFICPYVPVLIDMFARCGCLRA